jgi:hypothetical protein
MIAWLQAELPTALPRRRAELEGRAEAPIAVRQAA